MKSNATLKLKTPTTENESLLAAKPANRLLTDWRVAVLALVGLWLVIYVVGLSWPALLDDVDTVHAEAAREMLLRHDCVTLYTNGFRYLEKAPVMYWTLAASYKVFGVSNWSTRLPLVLGVLALVLATYRLGRYVYGEAGAFYAGGALVTSLGLYIFTRFLIPEVLVALWLTLGYQLFLESLEQERPSRLDVLGICGDLRAECADEGADRTGVSGRGDRAVSAADGEFAAPAEAAVDFQHAGIFRDRDAVALAGGGGESGAGAVARVSVVLLHQ